MDNSYINPRFLQFLLLEVLNGPELRRHSLFSDFDAEAFLMTLDAAKQLSDTYLYPIFREMDKDKAYYKDGVVEVHPGLKQAIAALAEGGWISAIDAPYNNGRLMPQTLLSACQLVFYAANANAVSYVFLTQGAARLIRNFGAEELAQTYIPSMFAGSWQGTMALTEPQAGSSLSDITSSATPTPEGHYLIKGQKIYISGGDHTAVDNVVHLLLARIKGAPAGTKGISLFVVPKYRPENGELVFNDVTTAGIFGKMGQKGYVAAHLMMGESDDCRGYLVGEPHKGLSYMFQLMNEARIGTGLMATGVASGAYQAALKYANERPQGRHPSNKDINQPQVLIIEHADVKRMLLFQKAVIEGSMALLLQCSYYGDQHRAGEGEEKENAHLLLELLTPIAKSYPSEMGTMAVSAGMQCMGGAGYCDDFPLEQYYRDIRVNAIYEGTTAIHGMDLLGRKIFMANGKTAQLYAAELAKTNEEAQQRPRLKARAGQLAQAAGALQQITQHLGRLAGTHAPEVFLADATLYLEYFSIVTIAWQWLKLAVVADRALDGTPHGEDLHFYESQLHTCTYYYEYELPKTAALHQRLSSDNHLTLDIKPAHLQ